MTRIILALAALALSAAPAHAYLDPGTGSYVLQMVIAGLLGAAFAVKTFWRSIAAFLAGLFRRKKNQDQPK